MASHPRLTRPPYGAKEEDEISWFFRVNVGAPGAKPAPLNPETMVVGVRVPYPFRLGAQTNLILDAEEMHLEGSLQRDVLSPAPSMFQLIQPVIR